MLKKKLRTAKIRVLAFKDSIIFPGNMVPLFSKIGKDGEPELDLKLGQIVFFVLQRSGVEQCNKITDIFEVGVMAQVLQINKISEKECKILVEGLQRGKIKSLLVSEENKQLYGQVTPLKDVFDAADINLDAALRKLLKNFAEFVSLIGNNTQTNIDFESLSLHSEPGKIVDSIVNYLGTVGLIQKQELLELLIIKERIARVLTYLQYELELLRIENKIEDRVKKQLHASQKEFYLNEKLKAVKSELETLGARRLEEVTPELDKLREKFSKLELSKEAKEKVELEMKRLASMPVFAAEAGVCRNYLETLASLPWSRCTENQLSLTEAEAILQENHYGLKKVKERILEYLAVQSRMKKTKGPILCLVGAPGVGKTSLGRSIARATGREFVRISLGGISDEAEIRGHRRTYIGAMPGKIIQNLIKCKVNNPLFVLDEIDKMAEDFRGDPASALLEVLDPEQNGSFVDHFLEVEYDLSNVMFIATANSLDIPYALLDRMEILRLEGYTEEEKVKIAETYLIPKQIKENGLKPEELKIDREVIIEIIRAYTQEAGVRSLERALAKICRKGLKQILTQHVDTVQITRTNLEDYLGVYRYTFGKIDNQAMVGEVNGLAWTEMGGDLLKVEVVLIPGKGKVTLTGQLGEVMQESVQAAITVVRSLKQELRLKQDFYEKNDIHLHVPEGATPKDGPSAGITVCTALVSAVTKIPARVDVAMTGEITLSGKVLAIGGLKEKLLAALRGGIRTVFIPKENERDLKEMPQVVIEQLEIIPVDNVKEVLSKALEKNPLISKINGKKVEKRK